MASYLISSFFFLFYLDLVTFNCTFLVPFLNYSGLLVSSDINPTWIIVVQWKHEALSTFERKVDRGGNLKQSYSSGVTGTGLLPADRLLPHGRNYGCQQLQSLLIQSFHHLTCMGWPTSLGPRFKIQGLSWFYCLFGGQSSWAREAGFVKGHCWHGKKKRSPSKVVCHNQKTAGCWADKTKVPQSPLGKGWLSNLSERANWKPTGIICFLKIFISNKVFLTNVPLIDSAD